MNRMMHGTSVELNGDGGLRTLQSWRGGREMFGRSVKPNLPSASTSRHGCEAQLSGRRSCVCYSRLWTAVRNRGCLEREEASALLASYPKGEAAEAQRLGGPDQRVERSLLWTSFRAMDMLLGPTGRLCDRLNLGLQNGRSPGFFCFFRNKIR